MKSWIAKVLTDHFSEIEFFVPMHSVWPYLQCTINDLLQKCLHPIQNATQSFGLLAKMLTSTLFGMQKCLHPSIAPPHKHLPLRCIEVYHIIDRMTGRAYTDTHRSLFSCKKLLINDVIYFKIMVKTKKHWWLIKKELFCKL